MRLSTHERLFNPTYAFEHPVTCWVTVALVIALAASPLVIRSLAAAGRISDAHRKGLWIRWRA